MEAWSLSSHLVEEEGAGEEVHEGGRERGGFSGPPPNYESQHDEGDYKYNAPQQDHGYDAPPQST
ncbi:unnamed protein product [Eruca vesicaria subsp. sativa]|uniref:Uncharacterized protein n=1 Tax=Eruca vesicaria subsp. sativa TaxID=29727 RepID=A0ABC8JYT3_ERUVS|nr:unnamed protein product [Eruca vesicaria subsp. sativa]